MVEVALAVAKPKRRPRVNKVKRTEVNLRDIRLLPPAKTLLVKAEAILRDEANLEEVRKSKKITHIAVVGAHKTYKQFGYQCHANMPGVISRYDWNGRSIESKRRSYNYRYFVSFSNDCRKAQYYEENTPFTSLEVKAVRRWYSWWRNKSNWSRFFVGPTDTDTLFRCGCIIDLSAPSFVVHFIAVAWRMPAEYMEMVLEWYKMVRKGVEPHIALGMAQNVQGFYTDEHIETMYSLGHNLIGIVSIETIARFLSGWCRITDKASLKPARESYETYVNYAYSEQVSSSWLQTLPKKIRQEKVIASRWSSSVQSVTPASAFRNPWDAGWASLMVLLNRFLARNGWAVA